MASSDLAIFLRHSLELEAEAQQRYQEMSEVMAAHNNPRVAAFFLEMVAEAGKHLAEVEALAAGMELPDFNPWEFDWPQPEAPESASYEALHYRMSLHDAMQLALAQERSAEGYYRAYSTSSADPDTAQLAARFADEERSHAHALEQRIASLSDEPVHGRMEDDLPHTPE